MNLCVCVCVCSSGNRTRLKQGEIYFTAVFECDCDLGGLLHHSGGVKYWFSPQYISNLIYLSLFECMATDQFRNLHHQTSHERHRLIGMSYARLTQKADTYTLTNAPSCPPSPSPLTLYPQGQGLLGSGGSLLTVWWSWHHDTHVDLCPDVAWQQHKRQSSRRTVSAFQWEDLNHC